METISQDRLCKVDLLEHDNNHKIFININGDVASSIGLMIKAIYKRNESESWMVSTLIWY